MKTRISLGLLALLRDSKSVHRYADKIEKKKETNVLETRFNIIELKNNICMNICIRYTTIDTKEADRIGYNGFLFRIRTQVKAEVRTGFFFRMSTHVKALVLRTLAFT